jgi:hypothetical protein
MKNHGLTAVFSVFHASHEPLRGSLLSPPSFQMGNSRWIRGSCDMNRNGRHALSMCIEFFFTGNFMTADAKNPMASSQFGSPNLALFTSGI